MPIGVKRMDQNPTGDAPQGQRSKAIFEIGYEVLLATDLNEALTVVVEGVRKVLSAEASAAITLVDRTGRLDPGTYQVAGPMSDVFLSEKPRPVGGLGAWVVDKKTAIYESDVQATESREHPAIRQNRLRVGAYACLPLLLRDCFKSHGCRPNDGISCGYEHTIIPNRSDRQPVGYYPAIDPTGKIWWTTAHAGYAAGHQQHVVHHSGGHPVAIASERVSQVAERLQLLSEVAR